MFIGRMVCQPDPELAAVRDRSFLDGSHPPLPAFPHLVDGILQRGADGAPTPCAGLLSPHGRLRVAGREGWLDALTGGGFVLIGRGTMQSPDRHPDRPDIHMIDLAADGTVDLDGRYEVFLDEHGLAMPVRPDFVVFGGVARIEEAGALLDRLGTALPGPDPVARRRNRGQGDPATT